MYLQFTCYIIPIAFYLTHKLKVERKILNSFPLIHSSIEKINIQQDNNYVLGCYKIIHIRLAFRSMSTLSISFSFSMVGFAPAL